MTRWQVAQNINSDKLGFEPFYKVEENFTLKDLLRTSLQGN